MFCNFLCRSTSLRLEMLYSHAFIFLLLELVTGGESPPDGAVDANSQDRLSSSQHHHHRTMFFMPRENGRWIDRKKPANWAHFCDKKHEIKILGEVASLLLSPVCPLVGHALTQ